MENKRIGIDYSTLHKLDSPANRLVRQSIWGDEDIGQQSFITPWYLDELARRLGISSCHHVLDVGSGVGGPAIYLAKKTGCRISGIDISPVGVERARKFAQECGLTDRALFYLGDAHTMPFTDESFDFALSIDVMNVFPDKVRVFREVKRVLKPGGVFAFLSGTFDMPDDPDIVKKMSRGYLILRLPSQLPREAGSSGVCY